MLVWFVAPAAPVVDVRKGRTPDATLRPAPVIMTTFLPWTIQSASCSIETELPRALRRGRFDGCEASGSRSSSVALAVEVADDADADDAFDSTRPAAIARCRRSLGAIISVGVVSVWKCNVYGYSTAQSVCVLFVEHDNVYDLLSLASMIYDCSLKVNRRTSKSGMKDYDHQKPDFERVRRFWSVRRECEGVGSRQLRIENEKGLKLNSCVMRHYKKIMVNTTLYDT